MNGNVWSLLWTWENIFFELTVIGKKEGAWIENATSGKGIFKCPALEV